MSANNDPGDSNEQRQWLLGRVRWAVLLAVQLIAFAHASALVIQQHGLPWIAWLAVGWSLPMLTIRRVLPPSLLASNARLLAVVSGALALAGWLLVGPLRGIFGASLFGVMSGLCLGIAIWLSMLGLQGVGGAKSRGRFAVSLDQQIIGTVLRRPAVWLSFSMVVLSSAGVVFAASVWPSAVDGTGGGVTRRQMFMAMLFFWAGGWLGAMPPVRFRRLPSVLPLKLVLPIALLVSAAVLAVLPRWPEVLAIGPALVPGFAWAACLRDAGEILRADLHRSLRRQVPGWLLTWAGGAAVFAGLLAFSLAPAGSAEDEPAGSLELWLRFGLPGVTMVVAGAWVAWRARNLARDRTGEVSNEAEPCWLDFPGLRLERPVPAPDDSMVVEIAYAVPEENRGEFFEVMAEMERVRFEEGALWWSLTDDAEHTGVYHEFFRVESWSEYSEALKDESERSRALKQRAFAANEWESMPAEIHYPVRGQRDG